MCVGFTFFKQKNNFFLKALHVLCGQTEYQNISGTRTAIDLVEIPSQFMELFTQDYRTLSLFAHHHSTGEVLPEKLLRQELEKEKLFAALNLQEQIALAMLDILLFGPAETQHKLLSTNAANALQAIDPITLYEKIKNKYTSVPFTQGTSYPGRFLHLSNYAAGYYSYLHCHMISAHIWQRFFENNPMDAKAGAHYYNNFLKHGGGLDPQHLLKEVLKGEEPNPSYLLKELGIYK